MAVVAVLNEQEKAQVLETVSTNLEAHYMAEEKRHEDALREWTTQWAAQEKTLTEKRHVAEVDKDVHRSGLLANGLAMGLTLYELVERSKLRKSYISDLLRYHRFTLTSAMAEVLTERRFRDYWKESRDPNATQGRRKPDELYEQRVFQVIAEKINAGKDPLPKEKRIPKPKEMRTREQQLNYTKRLREEVRQIYKQMEQDITYLVKLRGTEQIALSPERISSVTARLEEGFHKLGRLLKDQTHVDVL
jgi:hypothetical protein